MVGGEASAVQSPLVRYAVEAGWTYLTPEEALDLIEVEYEELSMVMDAEAAMEQEAPLVHENRDSNRIDEIARVFSEEFSHEGVSVIVASRPCIQEIKRISREKKAAKQKEKENQA